MTRSQILRGLLVVSYGYWLVVVGAIIANALLVPTFKQVGHLSRGCYQTDAMLIYVKCVGFFGAEIVGFVLTLPWYMLQVLWFVFSPYIFVGLPLALLLWGPLVFPIVYWARRAAT